MSVFQTRIKEILASADSFTRPPIDEALCSVDGWNYGPVIWAVIARSTG